MDLYLLKFPFRKFLGPLLSKLKWLHPDVVSYLAVPVAAATGWCFYAAAGQPWLLMLAIVLIFLRMTLNTLDGILAIQRGNLSLRGEIVNALPDRYSDIFLLVGISVSPLCRSWLGILALCSVLLVSYSGMLGKALTVSWQHSGPMGKVERLILMMILSLVQYLALNFGWSFTFWGITSTPLEWLMCLYVILGQITVIRRVRGQTQEIDRKESLERLDSKRNIASAVVIYDSMSGNTQKVAEQIAAGLGCLPKSCNEIDDLSRYELAVIGSPNIRRKPTAKLVAFLQSVKQPPARIALFATYGLPAWGPLTSGSCMSAIASALCRKPVARFTCPGFHKKYRTFKKRPNDDDLLKAYIYGLHLSRYLKH
jgi:archaetidylinositol phosphate synthase